MMMPVVLGACPRCKGAISLMGDQYGDDWRCCCCGWAGETFRRRPVVQAPKKKYYGRRCCVCLGYTDVRCLECSRYMHRDRDACRKGHECAAKRRRAKEGVPV